MYCLFLTKYFVLSSKMTKIWNPVITKSTFFFQLSTTQSITFKDELTPCVLSLKLIFAFRIFPIKCWLHLWYIFDQFYSRALVLLPIFFLILYLIYVVSYKTRLMLILFQELSGINQLEGSEPFPCNWGHICMEMLRLLQSSVQISCPGQNVAPCAHKIYLNFQKRQLSCVKIWLLLCKLSACT